MNSSASSQSSRNSDAPSSWSAVRSPATNSDSAARLPPQNFAHPVDLPFDAPFLASLGLNFVERPIEASLEYGRDLLVILHGFGPLQFIQVFLRNSAGALRERQHQADERIAQPLVLRAHGGSEHRRELGAGFGRTRIGERAKGADGGCLRAPVRLTMASAGHQVPGEVQGSERCSPSSRHSPSACSLARRT